MIHMKVFGSTGATVGLGTLLAADAAADWLNFPVWFKEIAAAAAVIGSTILFLRYISTRDVAASERDKLFSDTLAELAKDFREDREKDRQERREGWAVLSRAIDSIREKRA